MDASLATAALAPPPAVAGGAAGASIGPAAHSPAPAAHVDAGYGVNLSGDLAAFGDSLRRVRAGAPGEPSAVARAMVEPLDRLNVEAKSLADYAESALASGNELTPSEIVRLTAASQEFMFEAQLTANIANRSADGLQQLFRQQG